MIQKYFVTAFTYYVLKYLIHKIVFSFVKKQIYIIYCYNYVYN